MELSLCACLLLSVGLARALPRPHGYGVTADAAGSIGSLPLTPLPVPGGAGFSATYSKSSSSSFASASAGSSSSSYSYSGAVPGFGAPVGCGDGCPNRERNEFGAWAHGLNSNGGSGGLSGAGAKASAGAIVSASVAEKQLCDGTACSSPPAVVCSSGQCDASGGGLASAARPQSAVNEAASDDYAVNVSRHTDANKNTNDRLELSYNDLHQTPAVVPFGAGDVARVKALPERQHQETACATHECGLANPNQLKPSSYNVPILGNPQTSGLDNSICISSECHIPLDVNPPSRTLQAPSGAGPTWNPSYASNGPSSPHAAFRPTSPSGPLTPTIGSTINPSSSSVPSGDGPPPPASQPFYAHGGSPTPGSFYNPPFLVAGAQQASNVQPVPQPSPHHSLHPSYDAAHNAPYEPFQTNPNHTFPPIVPSHGTSFSGPSGSGNYLIREDQSLPTTPNDALRHKSNCIAGNCGHPSAPSYDAEGIPPHSGSATNPLCSSGNCAHQQLPDVSWNLKAPEPQKRPRGGVDSLAANGAYGGAAMQVPHPSNTGSDISLSSKGSKTYSGGFGGAGGFLSAPAHSAPSNGADLVVSPVAPQESSASEYPLIDANISGAGAAVSIPHVANNGLNKKPYRGGFGAPAGLLKPNEFQIPPNTRKAGCLSGNCYPSEHIGASGSGGQAVVASAKAASFSGTFGGPPGLLKPYDSGTLDHKSNNMFGRNRNDFGHPQLPSTGSSASQTSAAATTTAGRCAAGCPAPAAQEQGGAAAHGAHAGASASASATSTAGSYGARSAASATANAFAGASA